jgi:hypothetical protein
LLNLRAGIETVHVPYRSGGQAITDLLSGDGAGMNVAHELVEGAALEGAIGRLFADPAAAYLHVHYASAGCYAARVDRA